MLVTKNVVRWICSLSAVFCVLANSGCSSDKSEQEESSTSELNSELVVEGDAVSVVVGNPVASEGAKGANVEPIEKRPESDFSRVLWTDLIPQDDLDALLNLSLIHI